MHQMSFLDTPGVVPTPARPPAPTGRGLKIPLEIMQILDRCKVDGRQLVLPEQLDWKVYAATNKVLEAIGGAWNRKAKAHVFDRPVADVLDPVLETGEYHRTKQDFGQFDTPPEIVAMMIERAQLKSTDSVLEPSAGLGNIALAAAEIAEHVLAIEIDPLRAKCLGHSSVAVWERDFLLVGPEPRFDVVLMNPPFAGQVDIDHVRRAALWLKPGGRLVSIMSGGVLFRTNAKTEGFRRWAERTMSIEPLPPESFASSGTSVHTCLVVSA
jgi:protein-L-isoaspartate O-methyltransferase